MRYVFLVVFLFFISEHSHAESSSPKHQKCESEYLLGKIPPGDKKHHAFAVALKLMAERGIKTIVETGTARDGSSNYIGDGGSTLIWAAWAQDHQATLYSVDIDPVAIRNAGNALTASQLTAKLVTGDSIAFLKGFDQPIDFLYLDSFDFDSNNPAPSQNHHLREILAAMPRLTPSSVVMIDDCDLVHGGKGKLVIEYLVKQGWKVVESSYQVILTHP